MKEHRYLCKHKSSVALQLEALKENLLVFLLVFLSVETGTEIFADNYLGKRNQFCISGGH